MSTNLTLLLVMGVLFAAGIYLLLERSLTKVLLGIVLVGNAVNLLILATGGAAGRSPLYAKDTAPDDYSDPLPQALILTAIVITFAVTAFMLAMIYRSWIISRADEVMDDDEDQRVAEQSNFDPEDDAVIAVDTTEFAPDDPDAAPSEPKHRKAHGERDTQNATTQHTTAHHREEKP